jgi:prolyl-tRNA synthetase
VAKNSVALARRDVPGREGKQFVSQDGLSTTVSQLLEEIQSTMLEKAGRFQEEHTHEPSDYEEFKDVVKDGFARVWWDGDNEDELRVKEQTKATIRCYPNEQPGGVGRCIFTGREAKRVAIFSRAY